MVAIASIELVVPVEQGRVIESAAGMSTGRAVARPVNAAIQRGPCAATNTRRMPLAARMIEHANTCYGPADGRSPESPSVVVVYYIIEVVYYIEV